MLVVSRKIGESVALGDDILITVLPLENGHVKLGIAAPEHVAIRRIPATGAGASKPAAQP